MKRKKLWVALAILTLYPFTVKSDDFATEVTTEIRKAIAVELGPLGNFGVPLHEDEFGLINATPFYLKINANADTVAIMWPGDVVPFGHGVDLMRPVGFPICITIRAYLDTGLTTYVGGYQLYFSLGSYPLRESRLIRVSDIKRVDGGYFYERDLPPPRIRRFGPYHEKKVHVRREGHNASAVIQLLNNRKAYMEVLLGLKYQTTVAPGGIYFKVLERYPHVAPNDNPTKELILRWWNGETQWGDYQEPIYIPDYGIAAYLRNFGPEDVRVYGGW